ncbi:MAG: ABC transporter ATP-binding protein [SAR202 cluster bacterium]|jgi:ABC-2 type transport system ATP-binding protein|nr:ABC transporter ATP-binding protein [SAR202 cluster bacterium]MDP6514927.1 ABC transporter ATP-binding protein [SAR202 cluster bacterium]MDP6713169.1 ABC transporter ATP-binding protein [SAR202 cluster bacterium]
MQPTESAIQLNDLTKVFGRGKKSAIAADRVSMQVRPGEVLGFLGHNGAGKTTTIKMICGLITPTSGGIKVNGYDARRQKKHAMRQIGAVLEGTRNVYWRLSAWQNLMYFGRLKGVPNRQIGLAAQRLLGTLDLWDRRHEKIRNFSRGMQQKVAIASALVSDPPVILLDEPTLGLDVEAARTVKNVVRRLAREENKAVLLTTHQLDIAEELCDRIAIMRQGRLVTDKPTDELLSMFSDSQDYVIKLAGQTPSQISPIPSLTLSVDDQDTSLRGQFSSQEKLLATLAQTHRAGFELLSVARVTPDLEDVFIELNNSDREVA